MNAWIKWISDHRWPMFLAGLLIMSITAQGIMVYFATRPDAPRPERGYYERSFDWDQQRAKADASRKLGWELSIDIPAGPQYLPGMKRPVDLDVLDPQQQPIRNLKGMLSAVRPANLRMNTEGTLTELPQSPGRYRVLLDLPQGGLWEFRVALKKDSTEYVEALRIDVPGYERNDNRP